jgi:hypothetical protein
MIYKENVLHIVNKVMNTKVYDIELKELILKNN